MENKYYLSDIESGFKYEVTKEHYDSFMKMWEMFIPKINHTIGVPLVFGTFGDMESGDLNQLFYGK